MSAKAIPPDGSGTGWTLRLPDGERVLARVVHVGCLSELPPTSPDYKRWIAMRPDEATRAQIQRDRVSNATSASATSAGDEPWIEKGKSFIRCPLCGSPYQAAQALAFVPLR